MNHPRARATTDEPDRDLLHELDGLPIRPVFILGDHRSGTTLLYQLLDGTGSFNVVRAYHLVHHRELLALHKAGKAAQARDALTASLQQQGQADRFIDGVLVSADLPEEYGFMLGDDPRPRLTPAALKPFLAFCAKVQWLGDPARPLLLKNPWDYPHFMSVKAAIPDARFVFVHRNPLHVVNSQIRALGALLSRRSPYMALLSPWYARLFERPWQLWTARLLYGRDSRLGVRITRRHVRRAAHAFLNQVSGLPPQDYVEICYEDLCRAPRATLARILDFTGGADRSGVDDYDTLVQPRSRTLCPGVERCREQIVREMAPYLLHLDTVSQFGLPAQP